MTRIDGARNTFSRTSPGNGEPSSSHASGKNGPAGPSWIAMYTEETITITKRDRNLLTTNDMTGPRERHHHL